MTELRGGTGSDDKANCEWMWSTITHSMRYVPHIFCLNNWIPAAEELCIVLIVAILITYLRHWVQKYFSQIGKKWRIEEWDRFAESCWKLIVYIILFVGELLFIFVLDIFPNTSNCWKSWPNNEMTYSTKNFYFFQMGFYVHSSYTHFTIETKRSDFVAMAIHHVTTFALLYSSFKMRFHAIGILVLICHDFNDIFLEITKICAYRKSELDKTISFLVMTLSWIVTRLLIFPCMIIYSTAFEAISFIPFDMGPSFFFYSALNIGLVFLLFLHVYWFGLILKIVYNAVAGDGIEDVREDEE